MACRLLIRRAVFSFSVADVSGYMWGIQLNVEIEMLRKARDTVEKDNANLLAVAVATKSQVSPGRYERC